MTITYVWSDVRDRAIMLFGGESPGAELESNVIDVFEDHPKLVVLAIEKVAEQKRVGKITSGWGVLRSELQTAAARSSIQATDSRDRTKAVRNAEQWMRAAGKHYDRWPEVEEELFGERGLLSAYDSPKLREKMRALWDEARPEGELIEKQAEERAEKWKQQRHLVPVGAGEDDIPL